MSIRSVCKLVLSTLLLSLAGCSGGVLDPKGHIAVEERNLIFIATGLMLLVVIPVIVMTLYFAWKYRASRTQEVYSPKWAHSTKIEIVVWAIPIIIIAILSTIVWRTTHELDPYKPITGKYAPIPVEVISLNWKWLFIYPNQGIATVNELVFPKDTPLAFHITADTTMTSFFIPQLGGQIYAMAGMETKLHLIANEAGTYKGISANFSGPGHTGMKFKAIATETPAEFNAWVQKVKQSGKSLNMDSYNQLAKNSENNPVEYFSSVQPQLFHKLIMRYMKNYGNPKDYYHKPADSSQPDMNTAAPITNAGQ